MLDDQHTPSAPIPLEPQGDLRGDPTAPGKVEEEYFANQPTGVEAEEEASAADDPEPWDPEKIRVHTKHFSLRNLVDMIAEGDLDLAPDFQRKVVWTDHQRCELIESLLLGIPLPNFYFNEDPTGRLQVVDGVQRLTTIYQFVHQKTLRLKKLRYLRDLDGQLFDSLSGLYRRRLQSTQFVAQVIDPRTPYRVKFDIFRRINTGGTPLSAQEIRHCMGRQASRDFLRQLTDSPSFRAATGGSLVDHPRMADREIALRCVAFLLYTPAEYRGFRSLDRFLGEVTERIDRTLLAEDLEKLRIQFERGMQNAFLAFGDMAFRRWSIGVNRKYPVNRSLAETWSTILANYSEDRVRERREVLETDARAMMTFDQDFINSINGSTGDPAKVETRFAKVSQAAFEALT